MRAGRQHVIENDDASGRGLAQTLVDPKVLHEHRYVALVIGLMEGCPARVLIQQLSNCARRPCEDIAGPPTAGGCRRAGRLLVHQGMPAAAGDGHGKRRPPGLASMMLSIVLEELCRELVLTEASA